jgi:DNA-binding XRE family transcriptional regulator
MLEKKYHPVDICVGKQLRKRRLKLAMSQEELAKNVHLTFQQKR